LLILLLLCLLTEAQLVMTTILVAHSEVVIKFHLLLYICGLLEFSTCLPTQVLYAFLLEVIVVETCFFVIFIKMRHAEVAPVVFLLTTGILIVFARVLPLLKRYI